MHRGDPCGVPLCTYEHPNGVLIPTPKGLVYATLHKPRRVCVPDPVGVRLRYVFLFVVARSAFGFPAPLPPEGWYRTPLGSGNTNPEGVGIRYVTQTPKGLCTGPRRGPVTLRFSFRSRTVSLRLPGSLTTRRVVPDPVGVR